MNDYSFVQRLLHRLALGPGAIREMAFDLETSRLAPAAKVREGAHVFVTALARAGTTILTRDLHSTDNFSSLTYSDMPFVLAPNLWARLNRGKRHELKPAERAHGDGIEVDSSSPEAFEEVFWRTFQAAPEQGRDRVVATEVALRFERFIQAVMCRYDKPRYLSKNNGSIARLRFLCEHFPNAVVLVPFRRPEDHAHSLLRQHRRFVEMQTEDRFVLNYMNWLGHNEFGLGYRPPAGRPVPELAELERFEYWLEEWRHVYTGLLEDKRHCGEQMLVVSHERLCAGEPDYWPSILEKLALPTDLPNSYRSKPAPVQKPDAPGLSPDHEALYRALEDSAR